MGSLAYDRRFNFPLTMVPSGAVVIQMLLSVSQQALKDMVPPGRFGFCELACGSQHRPPSVLIVISDASPLAVSPRCMIFES